VGESWAKSRVLWRPARGFIAVPTTDPAGFDSFSPWFDLRSTVHHGIEKVGGFRRPGIADVLLDRVVSLFASSMYRLLSSWKNSARLSRLGGRPVVAGASGMSEGARTPCLHVHTPSYSAKPFKPDRDEEAIG
jgi:hypothetical protein